MATLIHDDESAWLKLLTEEQLGEKLAELAGKRRQLIERVRGNGNPV